MARVRVPQVGINLPVYHGTTDDVIAKGAGHLYGTSLPVGGESAHAVLTSHTGMSDATLFDNLKDVKVGDLMFVDVMGETLAYKVDQIKVVLPHEIEDLTTIPGKDYLTLFTCTPYAVNTHRLLVRGERVEWSEEVAAVAETETGLQIQPWMYWLLGGAGAGTLLAIIMIARERKRRAEADEASDDVDAVNLMIDELLAQALAEAETSPEPREDDPRPGEDNPEPREEDSE